MKLSGDKKHRVNRNKKGVARYATPDQLSRLHPPQSSLAALTDAKSVLQARHVGETTWRVIAWELGGVNRGTLSAIASGDRYPSPKMIAKLNSAYGCSLNPVSSVRVAPLSCGHAPLRDRCPICKPPTKYAAHPVTRISALRRLMQSPYNNS